IPLTGKHAPDIVQDRGRSELVTNFAEDRQSILVPRLGTNQVSVLLQQAPDVTRHLGRVSSIPSCSVDLLSFLVCGPRLRWLPYPVKRVSLLEPRRSHQKLCFS